MLQEIVTLHYGKQFEPELLEEIQRCGIYRKVPKDDILIDIGSQLEHMPLLINGAIKVLREDEDGHELLLYFLEKGDTCAMTLTCCMRRSVSQIRAVAELDTELILLPVEKMEEWLSYKSWRDFVFESYNERLFEMLAAIDTLAFMNMNERLLKYLEDKAVVTKSNVLTVSHQDIALELNTSRVVISRLLKQLENEGKVHLSRNKLEVLTS